MSQGWRYCLLVCDSVKTKSVGSPETSVVSTRLRGVTSHNTVFLFQENFQSPNVNLWHPEDKASRFAWNVGSIYQTTRCHIPEHSVLTPKRTSDLLMWICDIVKTKPAGSPETSVRIYQTTRCHIPEHSVLTSKRTSDLLWICFAVKLKAGNIISSLFDHFVSLSASFLSSFSLMNHAS
jgi:hypothetical protein